jgi:hypothetical protein
VHVPGPEIALEPEAALVVDAPAPKNSRRMSLSMPTTSKPLRGEMARGFGPDQARRSPR